METKLSEIYDFCLDWQMQGEGRNAEWLKERFKEMQLPFLTFKEIASLNRWYVKSMNILEN